MGVNERFERLCVLRKEIARIDGAASLLEWDLETLMPKKGSEARADMLATLAALSHERLTSPEYRDLVERLHDVRSALPEPWMRRAVELEHRRWRRAAKLPAEFVRELARLTSASHTVWVEAKRSSDYGAFAPSLVRIIEMKREEAAIVGDGAAHPYDALLDEYEPGATVATVAPLLDRLRAFLVPFVARIAEKAGQARGAPLRIAVARPAQERLVRELAETFGFDFGGGCMGETEHPFMTTIHAGDSRVAVAYKEDDVADGVYSIIHEVGHALYEQGLPGEWDGLAVGQAVSLGIHESQSRLWENLVGRSREFTSALLGAIRRHGAADGVGEDDLYRAVNDARPSFIRTEADEVTYNLHVALRFDIERRLIEGSLAAADVRDAWNEAMRTDLGLEVADDAQGVLQDVHWSAGLFGYFPTYALGNLYAAQMFAAAEACIPDLRARIGKGDLRTLLGWLRERVHRHGSLYGPRELCVRATGSDLDPSFFIAHITRKYGELYGL